MVLSLYDLQGRLGLYIYLASMLYLYDTKGHYGVILVYVTQTIVFSHELSLSPSLRLLGTRGNRRELSV